MKDGLKFKGILIIAIIIFTSLLILPTVGNNTLEIQLKPDAMPKQIATIEKRFPGDKYKIEKKKDSILVEGYAITNAVMNEAKILDGVKDAKILPHWTEKAILAKKITLGLDLQGGMNLVLMADFKKMEMRRSRDLSMEVRQDIINKAIENIEKSQAKTLDQNQRDAVTRMADDVINTAFEKLSINGNTPVPEKDRLIAAEKAFEKAGKSFKKPITEIDRKDLVNISFEKVSERLNEKLSDSEKSDITNQALELIRNRIDKFGVSEPSIRPRGNEAIEIQLPGVRDPKAVKEALGKTGRVEYRLVDDNYTVKAEEWFRKNFKDKVLPMELDEQNDLLSKISKEISLPATLELLFFFSREEKSKKLIPSNIIALERTVALAGDDISKAWVGRDEYGSLAVHFKTTPLGAEKFANVTSDKNKHRKLAVIIDDRVRSMPRINEQIAGGSAFISGDFTLEEVNALSLIIKEGALPVNLNIAEERTVGPSLGTDSINSGKNAALTGITLVAIFMVGYYKLAGMISVFGIILNTLFLLALLSWLGFTLTLPGIAGIILNVGMAVDANVLIYERMKDELRAGKSIRAAVSNGFDRAFWPIFDSNITTLIAAFILTQFGTGPIKGFAVTLSIGIVVTLFVSLYITKYIYELILLKKNLKKLSI